MKAVIKINGHQYLVQPDETVKVEKVDLDLNKEITLDQILLVIDDQKIIVGQPIIKAKVKAEVIEHGKNKKCVSLKFKAKKGYRKKIGHRQPYSVLKINEIKLG